MYQRRSSNWASTRLQLLAFPFTVINYIAPIYLKPLGFATGAGLLQWFLDEPSKSQTAGFIGLAISFALALPASIGSLVLSVSVMETKFCSLQRINEVVVEALPDSEENGIAEDEGCLQARSGVRLEKVDVCYQELRDISSDSSRCCESQRFARTSLPPALVGVTAEARPGEHVGVIGRTGSGTLMK